MDDRIVPTKLVPVRPAFDRRKEARLRERFPTVHYLRQQAQRRLPRFSFDYMDGGAGTDGGIARNAAALDAVELVPRYGCDAGPAATDVTLFGRRYAAPIGVAPMGLSGAVLPGAEEYLAIACEHAGIPYAASTVGGTTLEQLSKLAPNVLWFQLYRLARNDHRIGFDLIRRAEAAGAHALVLTLDVPVRTVRPREIRNRLTVPLRPTLRTLTDIAISPRWLLGYLRYGHPRMMNFAAYVNAPHTFERLAEFARTEMGGGFSWEEVARIRDRWTRPLVVKGVLHPADAERAVSVGVDGVQVSNHGGRQIEAAPAAIDVLPAVASAVGKRATILLDSGIRSGLDVVRALALGADAVFAGKAFLYGLGAVGRDGAGYVTRLLIDEIEAALRQLGIASVRDARSIQARHPGAMRS
jgi:isopentenyl diphosphate isomerase/L-lactate dehydrogenase-like FMN-dependent dehydrogenase